MKKIILFLITILFIPNVYASEVNYNIKNYYIDASILENGDLQVQELIVMKGTFNGYIRDIVYKNSNLNESNYANNTLYNASGIELISIEAKYENNISMDTFNDTDFTTLTKDQAANLGYVESNISNGKSYKMYYKSNNNQVVFKLTYILKDVVVLHNDVGELYWTFIGDEYEDDINDIIIRINLPNVDDSDNFRVWAHGDLAGEVQKSDNQTIIASIDSLEAYNSIDVRTTFSKTLLNANLVKKVNNDEALEKIIEVETKRANEANQKRHAMKIKYYVIEYLSIGYIIILFIMLLYVYLKYDKEYKSDFYNKYYREFIDDYNVEVIDYLFTKNISPNAMSASIMNLIYKGVIKVEEIEEDSKKKNYLFTLANEDKATETEKKLINFLFDKVGKDNKFTTKELKKYAKSTSTCETFQSSYNLWKNTVISDAKNEEFYEIQIKPKVIGGIMLLIAIIIKIAASVLQVQDIVSNLVIVLGVMFLVYTLAFSRRTKKGNEHLKKWKAFKNFLKDFGTFDIKELPEIKLWDRYMVYATIFGLADKVSKAMNVKIKEMPADTLVNYNPIYYNYNMFYDLNSIVHSTITSNANAVTQKRANSVSSSGSGFGGGFSSGGGFGGGGGGGHGF